MLDGVSGPVVCRNGVCLTSFVSSDYLGFDHVVPPAAPLAVSMPRGVGVHAEVLTLEARLAEWLGVASALVMPSTLHALMDVIEVCGEGASIIVDRGAYALSVAAVDRMHARVRSVRTVDLMDLPGLQATLADTPGPRLVVADSLSLPARLLPLSAIVDACRTANAWFVVDDTQGMGLWGAKATAHHPYGLDGQGTLAFLGCQPWRKTVVVASLAKGLGVPVAFLAGAAQAVRPIRQNGTSIYSCSQPDLASVRCALGTLKRNQEEGQTRRSLLAEAVQALREEAGTEGLGIFPVQSWYFDNLGRARRAHQALLKRGIWALLHPEPRERPRQPAIRFFVTARHQGPVLARALVTLRMTREEFSPC